MELSWGMNWSVMAPGMLLAIVQWMWSGAASPHSIRVKARVTPEGAVIRLAVDSTADFATPLYSMVDTVSSVTDQVVDLPVAGLTPDSRYHYVLEINGALDTTMAGSFRTPAEAPESFTLAMGSCARTGSTHEVFNLIRSLDPLIFLHLGDFHYENIAVADVQPYRLAIRTVLASEPQAHLYRSIPIAYMWDDHDYGPNNGDSTAPGRTQARQTYREYIPHYPLAAGTGDVGIYQSFSIGRTRFILTDSRSLRSPYTVPDSPSKTMLGAAQKAWFKRELMAARDTYALIVWVNTLPWIGVTGDDGWYAYTFEREEIANFIVDSGITGLCMISGDAHMLAIDDGSHSNYSSRPGAGFPVLHAAALDQSGSIKGGPYSEGAFPGGGQFGLMQVTDTGDSMVVNWSGRDYLNIERVAFRFATSGACVVSFTGDINESGMITASDIIALVNFVFRSGTEPAPCTAAGDADCNGAVSSQDIVSLVSFVFKGGPRPCNVCRLIPGIWNCPNGSAG